MRFAIIAIALAIFLMFPLAISVLAAITAFACYTLYVWYAFQLHAPLVGITILEAAHLTLLDTLGLFRL